VTILWLTAIAVALFTGTTIGFTAAMVAAGRREDEERRR
jgi:hypothetical protein